MSHHSTILLNGSSSSEIEPSALSIIKSAYPFEFESDAVLSDTNAQINKGSIWEVSGIGAVSEAAVLMLLGGFDDISDTEDVYVDLAITGGFDDVEENASAITLDKSEMIELNEDASFEANEITGELTLRLYDKLPTVITGQSVVTYGIIIDNLYSPDSSAVFDLIEASGGIENGFTDVSNNESGKIVHSTTSAGYRTDENNRYAGVKTEEGE